MIWDRYTFLSFNSHTCSIFANPFFLVSSSVWLIHLVLILPIGFFPLDFNCDALPGILVLLILFVWPDVCIISHLTLLNSEFHLLKKIVLNSVPSELLRNVIPIAWIMHLYLFVRSHVLHYFEVSLFKILLFYFLHLMFPSVFPTEVLSLCLTVVSITSILTCVSMYFEILIVVFLI